MPKAIRFRQGLVKLKFNEKGISKATEEALKVLIRQGAREWLRATFVLVPVWTGMARGSLKFARGPNGTLAHVLNVAIPINPHPRARPTWRKNDEAGGRISEFDFVHTEKIHRFRFRTETWHYWHNEFRPRTDPGAVGQQIIAPWRSLVAGSAAMTRYLTVAGPKKLPKLFKYIETFGQKHVSTRTAGAEYGIE